MNGKAEGKKRQAEGQKRTDATGTKKAVESPSVPLTPALSRRGSRSKDGSSTPSPLAGVSQSRAAEGGATRRRGVKGSSAPTDHSPTYRLFYALKVPTEITAPLAEAQKQLRGNWRAVNPGQMHITLSFLPSVPPERVDDLKRLGAQLTQHLHPMNIRLRGTGYFPNEGSPRVWFVKVEAEGLEDLAAQLRSGVQALGIQTDDLPFKAHITLARKKGPAPRVQPLTFDGQQWTASSATLYRSVLRKTGPIYEVESTFRFRGVPAQAATSPPNQPSPTAERIPFNPDTTAPQETP